jgi:protein TonB
MGAEVAARTITNPPRRSRPVFAQATERAYPDTLIEPPPISQSDAPSSLPTEIAQENEIANHVLGQVLHSVRRYFVYPPFAQRAGWEGEVIVAFRINPDGEIRDVRLIRSSGYTLLDEDALLILRRIGSIPDARAWLRGGWYNAQIPVIYRLTG